LLRPDGEHGGVILSLRQVGLGNAPQLARPHARREAPRESRAIDQPFGLWIASDQSRWKQHALASLGLRPGLPTRERRADRTAVLRAAARRSPPRRARRRSARR